METMASALFSYLSVQKGDSVASPPQQPLGLECQCVYRCMGVAVGTRAEGRNGSLPDVSQWQFSLAL